MAGSRSKRKRNPAEIIWNVLAGRRMGVEIYERNDRNWLFDYISLGSFILNIWNLKYRFLWKLKGYRWIPVFARTLLTQSLSLLFIWMFPALLLWRTKNEGESKCHNTPMAHILRILILHLHSFLSFNPLKKSTFPFFVKFFFGFTGPEDGGIYFENERRRKKSMEYLPAVWLPICNSLFWRCIPRKNVTALESSPLISPCNTRSPQKIDPKIVASVNIIVTCLWHSPPLSVEQTRWCKTIHQ